MARTGVEALDLHCSARALAADGAEKARERRALAVGLASRSCRGALPRRVRALLAGGRLAEARASARDARFALARQTQIVHAAAWHYNNTVIMS